MTDQTIQITRPSTSAPIPAPVKQESKFPSETINLPSQGWFYDSSSPLSSGKIDLKMMTAKEEDILTSKNLIQKNIVLDKLLESVVIDKTIKLNDMLICDRNAVFFAIRRLAYGDEYSATISCGRCGKENTVVIDLSKIDNRPFEFEKYARGENSFEFKLPTSGKTVTFKLLTKRDENSIDAEITGMAKISKEVSREVTTRLSYLIKSIDGNTDRKTIRTFINEELRSIDSLALRKYIRENTPDIDSSFDFSCAFCGLERKEETPMGVSFFWPNG